MRYDRLYVEKSLMEALISIYSALTCISKVVTITTKPAENVVILASWEFSKQGCGQSKADFQK